MKIERVQPYLVDRALIVRVYTNEGVIGTGEAGLWAHHRLVMEALNDLGEYFVGRDAGDIEHHHQSVTRDAHFAGPVLAAALSAVDIALWDILGQATGKSVAQLLGGPCRNKLSVFMNIAGAATVGEFVDRAKAAVAAGYTSLRLMPFLPEWEKQPASRYIGAATEIVSSVREAVGFGIDLGVEIHRNLGPDEAVVLAHEIEAFRMLYFEDPVAPESLEALKYVADRINIPVAAGERSFNLFQFDDLLQTRAVSMIRPDLSLAGGFTQCKKIAALAEARFVKVFPHLMGSPVNVAAFVQFGASIPNYALMEPASGYLNDIVEEPLSVQSGHIHTPTAPGIGVRLREEMLARFPYRPHVIRPATRQDGSVAH